MRGGAAERRRIALERRGETRRDFMPKQIPAVPSVGIAFILDPPEAAGLRAGSKRFARERDQGSQEGGHAAPNRRHGGQPTWAGTAQQLQQHGFGLIVGVMCEGNHLDVACHEALVSFGPRQRFEALPGLALEVQPMHRQRHRARRALLGAEACPSVGVGRQSVVNVDRRELERMVERYVHQRVEKHHRIDAPRERNRNPRIGSNVGVQRIFDGRDYVDNGVVNRR